MDKQKKEMPTISLGLLRMHLEHFPDDYEVYFGGLEFYRLKVIDHENKIVHLQFNQTVCQDQKGNVVVENH